MRKECGNIYLDIDVTTGSEVSGTRDGTATGAPLQKIRNRQSSFLCVPSHNKTGKSREAKECDGGEYQESGDDGDKARHSNGERNKICI